MKRAYDILVKDLPEDQREGVSAQIARQARRAVVRSQAQGQRMGETVGV
jgi:lipase chaperone LimK